jgi:hypothetical protein
VVLGVLSGPEFARFASAEGGEELLAARNRLAEVEARLDLAADDWTAGRITHRQHLRITAQLRAQAADAEAEIGRHSRTNIVAQYAGPDGAALWDAAPIGAQRAVLALLFRIQLLPTGRGRRVFDPASVDIVPAWVSGPGSR